MGLAGHRIRPCYLGDWEGGFNIRGRGGVRFKATVPGSPCGSLENRIESRNIKQGSKNY